LLQIAETMATLGVSSIMEYVVRRGREGDLARITSVAECVVLVVSSGSARVRLVERNLHDRLLNRRPVLGLLGYGSIEDHTREAVARSDRVSGEMLTEFDLPTMRVQADADRVPGLEEIIKFVTSPPKRTT
jgi:hypothetical protein